MSCIYEGRGENNHRQKQQQTQSQGTAGEESVLEGVTVCEASDADTESGAQKSSV